MADIQTLYHSFKAADDTWHNALVAEYGERGAVVECYRVQGKDCNQRFPDHIWQLCVKFRQARDAYLNAVRA